MPSTPVEKIHRGAVEERVALAEQRHVLPALQPPGDGLGRRRVTPGHGADIAAVVMGDLDRHRVVEA
jgi:hypothetical protein